MSETRDYNDPKMFDPLDDEEVQIMADRDNYKNASKEETAKMKMKFKIAAKNTLKKTERTNIRLSEADLLGLKMLAAQEGVGYQTLISSILHKAASGQLQIH